MRVKSWPWKSSTVLLPERKGNVRHNCQSQAPEELAEDDPDGQTLLFRYPAGIGFRPADEPAYIQPIVRLEIGARSG